MSEGSPRRHEGPKAMEGEPVCLCDYCGHPYPHNQIVVLKRPLLVSRGMEAKGLRGERLTRYCTVKLECRRAASNAIATLTIEEQALIETSKGAQ